MALTISNNNYCGVLAPGLSSLISIGANDYTLWNSATTNGSKVRLSYVDATVVLQDLSTGICAFVDSGDRTLDFMNLDLFPLGSQQSACISELYNTDYANANFGQLNQEVDAELLNAWASRIVDKYSKSMQDLRWSGDTASLTPALAYHDGIVKLVQGLGAWVVTVNEDGYQKQPTIAVTAANVIAEIDKSIALLPFEVKGHAGFKIVVGPLVANALQQAAMVTSGVNNLNQVSFDPNTGHIMNYFTYPVYMAKGLGATAANSNVIMSGVFEDSSEGAIKWGVNTPSDEKDIEVKLVNDGDNMRIRVATSQAVAVIPDGSQIAMNI